MLHYPVNASGRIGDERIDLKLADINCLKPQGFLNDQVVDFYLKFIHQEKLDFSIRENIHLFSSLFYTSLESVIRPDKQSGWTRRVPNLFDKKFLVIPVVTSGHWLLAIICNAGKDKYSLSNSKRLKMGDGTFQSGGQGFSSDVINKTDSENSMILILDSYQDYSPVNRFLIGCTLRAFLTNEWKFRHTTSFKFNADNMPLVIPKVPQQSNLFDCGIYTLQFFETFFLMCSLSAWLDSFKDLSTSWFQNFTKEIEKDKREQVYQTIRSLIQKYFGFTNHLSILPATSDLLPVPLSALPELDVSSPILDLKHRAKEILDVLKTFFENYGQRLGGASLPHTSLSAKEISTTSATDLDKVQALMEVDEMQPKTKVSIRMSDGSRLLVTLNPSQPISKIREFICSLHPDQGSRSFSLMTTFPSKEFSDESISIADAKLSDAVVTQKLK